MELSLTEEATARQALRYTTNVMTNCRLNGLEIDMDALDKMLALLHKLTQ